MSLEGWNEEKSYVLNINSYSVSGTLDNFPLLLNITDSSGINEFNCSKLFDDLEYNNVNDDFTGTDGDIPNTDLWEWRKTSGNTCTINTNRAKYVNFSGNDQNVLAGYFRLSGNIDIQVDVDIGSPTLTNSYVVGFQTYIESTDDIIQTGFMINSTQQYYIFNKRISGTWSDVSKITTSDTHKIIRVTRISNTFEMFHSNGSGWTSVGTFDYGSAPDVQIKLVANSWDSNPAFTAYQDTFTVNSGTMFWPQCSHPCRKNLAVEYIGYENHYIESIDDYFTVSSGTSPNSLLWDNSSSNFDIYNETLRITKTYSGSNVWYPMISKYRISGDASYQIDVNATTLDASNADSAELQLYIDGNNFVLLKLQQSSGNPQIRSDSKQGGTWTGNAVTTISTKVVQLKIERYDTKINTLYKENGGSWIKHTSFTYTTFNSNAQIRIGLYCTAGTPITYVDNFKLHFGGVVWGGNTPRIILKQSSENQPCYCEIEYWDQDNKSIQLWAKIPEIVSSRDTELRLYYDKNADGYITSSGTSGIGNFDFIDWTKNTDVFLNNHSTGNVTISGSTLFIKDTYINYGITGSLFSNFGIKGDFDVQVDVRKINYSAYTAMYFWKDKNNRGYIRYRKDNNSWSADTNVDGSWTSQVTSSATNTFGSLRIIRTGSSVDYKYRDGTGAWTLLTTQTVFNDEIAIYLYGYINSTYTTLDVEFSNFKINSPNSVNGRIGDIEERPSKAVWDDDYMSVYHMAQIPSATTNKIKDSTTNIIHATPVGTWASSNLVNGVVGKALYFSGSDQYLELNELATNMVGSSFTVDIAVKPDSTQPSSINYRLFAVNTSTGGNRVLVGGQHTNKDYNLYDNSSTTDGTHNVVSTTSGNIVSYTYDNATDYITLFVDGLEDTGNEFPTTAASISIASDDTFSIGQEFDSSTPGEFFAGNISEYRVSRTVRTGGWQHTTFNALADNLITYSYATIIYFSNPNPNNTTDYGFNSKLNIIVTVSGVYDSYTYDAEYYDNVIAQIISTVSGVNSGQKSDVTMSTPSGVNYSWYVVATSSGVTKTSDVYNFDNRFLAEGTVTVQGTSTSGIKVRLYKRNDGSLVNEAVSTASGTFAIETPYAEDHYCIALHDSTDYNALIYDHLNPNN